jgi:Protein of unknown function (DUF4012)
MKHRAPQRHVRVPVAGLVPLRVLIGVGCGVGLFILALLLTLVPLWLAHHDATEAANELNRANDALATQRLGDAQTSLANARTLVDAAQGHANGPVADMWSHLPVLGPAVVDGRHLISALDEATTAATIGVNLIDRATSPGSHLVEGTRVNIHEVEQLSTQAHQIGPHLRAAQAQINSVDGGDLLVGGKISSLKERAFEQLSTSEVSYRRFKPLLDKLPEVLGARGPRTYLVTIMNPAEQRYSGGATLQMATIRFEHGHITFGKSQSVADVDQAQPFLNWTPVSGNIFHPPGPRRLTAATYSPWWGVSGEELLRAWQAQTGQQCQGLIAIDLQALAELFRITGPMEVPGYGELDADNLVHTLAGSYDSFQDPLARRRLNNALVPAFQQKFLSGGKFIQKGRSLLQDAEGRHVALYFRDRPAQEAFTKAGFSGNLSRTRHDYLGVFSQNLNGSKSDYWQTRHISSQVTLHADGSASENMTLVVGNPSPPYRQKTPDLKSGYDTRWLGTSVGVFLPPDTDLESVTADGRPVPDAALEHTSMSLEGVRNRALLRHAWMLGPHQTGVLRVEYAVPDAATVDRSGNLTYQVDLDPQDLVDPQSNAITLTIPDGFSFGAVPAGWKVTGAHTAVLWVPQLNASGSWKVPILKD